MGIKPRVLLIAPLPPPHGGIATWTEKVFASSIADDFELLHIDTRLRGKRSIFDAARLSLAEIYRTLSIYVQLIFLLIMRRPQLVHLSCALSSIGVVRDYFILRLVNLFGVPTICHYRGNVLNFNFAAKRGLSGKFLKKLFSIATHNIVESNAAIELASSWVGTDKISMLPNFIEDELFQLEKRTITPPYRAIFVGGVTQQKGCLEILAVAEKFPAIEFHLFGKVHQDMQVALTTAPANVLVHGVCDNARLLEKMRESHFLFFPSHTEGFPLTVLEAMAMGLAVVSTSVGAIPEMIDANGGILVAPRDIPALCAALQKLIHQPALILTMGEYNRQKSFTHFSRSQVLAHLKKLYANLLQGAMPCVE